MDEEFKARESKHPTPHHTIRLRHPWQCESGEDTVVWSRKFNWPAELSEDEGVRLVIKNAPPAITVTLNESAVLFDESCPADITQLLAIHNRLVISAANSAPPPERFPYEVRLEIITAC